jgi:HPt (histidine-containing phosphotransfer) domain-containing protein
MVRPTRPLPVDPDILDIAHLRRYTQGNAGLETELMGLFNAQLPGLMDQISNGGVAGDWKFAVHTLKGSARAVGAVAIGNLAVRLEEAGHSAPAATREGLVDLLVRAVADFAIEADKLAV